MLLFGNPTIEGLVAIGFVLLIGMGIHEAAHAYMADWWGDPTPRSMGRLTLNPFVHISWVGWLMFVVIGFGILGSVPVNPRAMRDPRWGSFWTSFAGPLSNLAQAVVYAILFRIFGASFLEMGQTNIIMQILGLILLYGVTFNVLLFIFNLLPFFPMDGWHMLLAVLPGRGMNYQQIPAGISRNVPQLATFLQQPAYKWQQWAQASQTVFIGLIIFSIFASYIGLGFLSPLNTLISGPTRAITALLIG